jgi:hypothetical protein
MGELLRGILSFLGDALVFIVDLAEWVVVKWATMILDALIAVLSAIPVPTWLTELSGNIGTINPGVLYFIEPFQFGTGFAWVVSAFLVRFLIRRIPLVG